VSTELTPEKLVSIRQATDAATQEMWFVDYCYAEGGPPGGIYAQPGEHTFIGILRSELRSMSIENAEFIAKTDPPTVRAMLDALEAAWGLVGKPVRDTEVENIMCRRVNVELREQIQGLFRERDQLKEMLQAVAAEPHHEACPIFSYGVANGPCDCHVAIASKSL